MLAFHNSLEKYHFWVLFWVIFSKDVYIMLQLISRLILDSQSLHIFTYVTGLQLNISSASSKCFWTMERFWWKEKINGLIGLILWLFHNLWARSFTRSSWHQFILFYLGNSQFKFQRNTFIKNEKMEFTPICNSFSPMKHVL